MFCNCGNGNKQVTGESNEQTGELLGVNSDVNKQRSSISIEQTESGDNAGYQFTITRPTRKTRVTAIFNKVTLIKPNQQ